MHRKVRDRAAHARPLQAQLRQALNILDAVADGILIIDERGTIVDANTAAQTLFGVTLDDIAGRPLAMLLPDLVEFLPAQKLLARSAARGGLESDARNSGGEIIPVHLTISPSLESDSAQYLLIVRDFRAVRLAQQRVLETERLAAIGETMTALAHESRNALQRMQSCLTLLRLRGGDEVQALIDDLQSAQDQLQRLYEEVRSFAAPVQLELAHADLRDLLDETWRELEMQWERKGLAWRIRQSESLDTTMCADATRLAQVLRNVLENAIQASPDGSTVVATLEKMDAREPALELTVEDEGSGIDPAARERVFDLLYTTKKNGTGMGLAIARRIIHEHHGEISVRDGEGGGAKISVVLPREAAA
jgi:PAS domain S-box-containing protein